MTIDVKTLNPTDVSNAQNQVNAIAASALRVIAPKQFVYFAAFDGTNNDRDAVYKSGSK